QAEQTSCQQDSEMATQRVDRHSHNKIDLSLPGPGAVINAARCLAQDRGSDQGTESDSAGLGRVLQTRPRPNTLPQTRRLDRATNLVASISAMADHWLEAAATCDAV